MADEKYYTKFHAKVKLTTKSGLTMTSECGSPGALLVEALQCSFNVYGEEKIQALFDKHFSQMVATKKRFEEQKKSKLEN